MDQIPVHEEWDHIVVPVSYHPDIRYRVFFGTVNWERVGGGERTAYCVFVQFGRTEDWHEAINQHEIALQMPAHIVEEDMERVLHAVDTLRERRRTASPSATA